jgi:hypothetical protein
MLSIQRSFQNYNTFWRTTFRNLAEITAELSVGSDLSLAATGFTCRAISHSGECGPLWAAIHFNNFPNSSGPSITWSIVWIDVRCGNYVITHRHSRTELPLTCTQLFQRNLSTGYVSILFNPLRTSGNYMNHMLWQSVMLYFIFIGFVWFSL